MKRLSYERRIQLLALAAGLPGSFIALILLWTGSYSSGSAWTLTFLILSLWLGFALSVLIGIPVGYNRSVRVSCALSADRSGAS